MKKQKIYFSKMHGLGNDFIIINNIHNFLNISKNLIIKLSNRHTGIGCDQLLIVEKSQDPQIDFFYKIFNANGKEVNQCGNGARCFGRFVFLKKLTKKNSIYIATHTRKMTLTNIDKNMVTVDMGLPIFNTKDIPFLIFKFQPYYFLIFKNNIIKFSVVSVGNPHCIIEVSNINTISVKKLGAVIEKHALFPEKTNVSFMEIITQQEINLRVYERDIGETQACGSAACAAVVIGIYQKKLDNTVKVHLLGGILEISWKGLGYPVYMSGAAEFIFEGYIYI